MILERSDYSMTQPELEPDEIVNQLHLPQTATVIDSLHVAPTLLEQDMADPDSYRKKGNNPPSYTDVRSVSEVIEDEYDAFVQSLYDEGLTQIDPKELIDKFRKQLNQKLNTFVVVKNTGRAYLAVDNAGNIAV